jgi:diaminopimelate epimerase
MGLASHADLTFWKYHGLGNDFVVLERPASEAASLRREGVVDRICDRRRGVGADGVLLVDRKVDGAHARMVVLNKDGTRPEMCGNGVRCVVRHLVEVHGVTSPEVDIVSDAGVRSCQWSADEGWSVSVMMGPAAIDETPVEFSDPYLGSFTFRRVNMGNPHAVTWTSAPVETVDAVGRALNEDARFPDGVNVEFVEAIEDSTTEPRLDLVVFERGVGRTLACGTGACAAAAAYWYGPGGDEQGDLEDGRKVTVGLPGGDLEVEIVDGELQMTGPVRAVFKGQLASDALRD